MRRFLYPSVGLLVVLVLAVTGAGFWLYSGFTRPGPLDQDRILVIQPGSGVNVIARQLATSGIISDALIFRMGVRLLSESEPMKAGEYLFAAHLSSRQTVQLLQKGKTIVRRITFAEGLSSFAMVEQLNRTEGLVGAVAAPLAEGSMLPETYHFSFGDRRVDLALRMANDLSTLVVKLWADRDLNLPLHNPKEAIILASIVEKETGKSSERARVAGVFINRLRKRMRLQSDPTVVYGLTNGKAPLGRSLRRSDLKRKTPYNTYIIKRLPPTPIANPGRESIHAVLHPMKTNELYFVADGTGGHVFATSLKAHNRNVARWRKIEKKRKSGD